jgi:hypothetical protein
MSSKPFPRFCRDCRFSKPERHSDWNNRCFNPVVNANNSWALATNGYEGSISGADCHDERSKRSPFAKCGMKGKLWEPREDAK